MKLLMISGDRAIAQGKKGAFWYTLEGLKDHFERIDVMVPRSLGSARDDTQKNFENVYVHQSPVSLLTHALWIKRKGKMLIDEHHHDVCTVHEYPPFYNGLGARLLRRERKIPMVLEVHHVVGYPFATSLSEKIGKFLSWMVLKRHTRYFSAVRTVSESVKKALVAFGVDTQNIKIIPSFYLDLAMLASMKNTPKKYDAVFCSRLTDNKGLLESLDAVSQIPAITMLVIGDGPLKKRAEKFTKAKGIAHRVTFTGWLGSNEDVARAIASGKVFVMNSRSEGGPRVALEAMAIGVPVVATRVGVMPEVIQDGVAGFFSDGTPVDVAEKIKTILVDDVLRNAVSEKAMQIVQKFDRATVLKKYAEFLQSLV